VAVAAPAHSQVVPEGDAGGLILSAGAMGSGFNVQYGDRKMLGVTGFVDADTVRRLGIEAEGHWLEYHQTANVHAETYSIGGRYHFELGRFQPYAKGLIGLGEFNFPYNLAHGSYLVVTAGGGLDYRLSHRIYIRAADFEYQDWPQFTFGSMSSVGLSAGIRVRIFH
jgi:opacity protein-like surface antigen